MSTERRFDVDVKHLRERLLHMAALVEEAIGHAVHALVTRDDELARRVIEGDRALDTLEIEIDDTCMRLLARHQPEAGDLRFVAMVFKINNDLERMGDFASNIAHRTRELLQEPLLKPLADLPRMAGIAQAMVRDSLDALVRRDAGLAFEVCRRDDEVDLLHDQIFREQFQSMLSDPRAIRRALGLILVASYVERIADHATNIAEDVVYLVTGGNIKHRLEAL